MTALETHAPTATDEAYAELKSSILTCEIAPGALVTETGLTEATGRGRGAIREALARLAMEGLVEVQPRRGHRVTEVSLADVREVFEMRLLLEPYAARQAAAHADSASIEALHDLAHATFVAGDRASYVTYVEANREFHTRLAEASGNQRLAQSIRQLLEEMQRVLFLSLSNRRDPMAGTHAHHDVYDAVLAKDGDLAHDRAVQQIEDARARVIEALM